jgi:hypothetical protein
MCSQWEQREAERVSSRTATFAARDAMLPDALLRLISGHAPARRQLPTAADFYVPSLPGLDVPSQSKLKLFAGHLPAYNADGALDAADPHLYLFVVTAHQIGGECGASACWRSRTIRRTRTVS